MALSVISIVRPRPSEIQWMEENLVFESIRDEYFERLFVLLLKNNQYTIAELIDDFWTSGIESRKLFGLLSIAQQTAIRNLETETAIVWMNGVDGNDWSKGLPNDYS